MAIHDGKVMSAVQKVLVVTGASRGIGAAVARMAGRRGYRVCVNFLASGEAADAVVADITASGGEAIAVQADTSREDDVERLFQAVDRQLGPLTALVNNAGVLSGRPGSTRWTPAGCSGSSLSTSLATSCALGRRFCACRPQMAALVGRS